MAYLTIAIVFCFVCVLHKIIDGADEKNEREIEALHKEAYALVDKYYGDNPNLAKAKKTEVDAMVHGAFENVNRKYETKALEEVSTASERKKYKKSDVYADFNNQRAFILDEIDKAQMASYNEHDLAPYTKVSHDEGVDRLAKYMVDTTGMNYNEAYAKALRIKA